MSARPASTIYLDHNASTPPHPEVLETVSQVASQFPGNPGSRHASGRRARRVLEEARETIAGLLNARTVEVHFTSGGTEANNLALYGFFAGRTGAIAAPPGEHPSIEEPLKQLEQSGATRQPLPMRADGTLEAPPEDGHPLEQIRLATMLWAHNETGVVRDVAAWGAWCARHRIPLHVDAIQAIGRLPVDFLASQATSMSLAAHKFRGPRGIGALILRDGARLVPLLSGGHQEAGKRPGTECTALAAGMAKALTLWMDEQTELNARLKSLRNRLETGLKAALPSVVIHAEQAPRLPNTSSIAFPGADGDALLVALDLAGVEASLGSACASGSAEPAPILVAMGCPPEQYKASVRFSVGWTTTEADIEDALQRIINVAGRLMTHPAR